MPRLGDIQGFEDRQQERYRRVALGEMTAQDAIDELGAEVDMMAAETKKLEDLDSGSFA